MASNITQIGDAVNNLDLTFQNISTSQMFQNAIVQGNADSSGWLGLMIFIIFCISIFLHIKQKRQSFQVFNNLNLTFVTLSVILDLGIYLLIWGILEGLQLYVWLYTVFFVIATISLLKKETQSTEA